MILYFTGTGNTQFVGEFIANHIKDECVSLNKILKENQPLKFHSERPFVIMAPIYAWRFPIIIEELIKNAELSGNNKLYFIGTMGSQSGNCDKYLQKLTQVKNMEFMGFGSVAMPNNYVYGGKLPDKTEAYKQIESVIPQIRNLAEKISVGEKIYKSDKTPFASIASGAVNKLFNKFMISSKNFNISENCISCGKCVELCPVNNIALKDGKPVFEDKCLNCYSCINRCPKEAINIGKRTRNNGRYVCPQYSKWAEK